MIAVAILGGWSSLCAQTTIETVDETHVGVNLVGIDGTPTLKSQLAVLGSSYPIRDVLKIEFEQPAPHPKDHFEIDLIDGSRLHADLLDSKNDDSLRIRTRFSDNEFDLPIDGVRALRFVDVDDPRRRPVPPSAPLDSDRLYTVKGATITGVLLGVTPKAVRFEDAKLGNIELPWAQILGIQVAALGDKPKIAKDAVRVVFEEPSGSRVFGTLTQLDAKGAQLDSALIGKLTTTVQSLSGIALQLGRISYLSDRNPIEVVEGCEWISPEVFAKFHSWQRDQSVDRSGRPVSIGDRTFRKGLSVHSTSKLTFAIEPGDRRFQTWIGLDRSARPEQSRTDFGAVEFRVLIDGQEKAKHELNWQQAAVRLDLPLENAKRLELIVDPGKGLHILDRASWADARVLRD